MKHSKTETLHIYHTNDIHSHFENWPRISEYLLQKRSEHEQQKESCLVFDIGDFVDRSQPFTEATAGKGNTILLNQAHYDAVTIGNNEGITLSKNALEMLYMDAEFDVILGNLQHKDGSPLEWAVPYQLYTTRNGHTVAVLAATAVYETFYNKLGWTIQEPQALLQTLAAKLRSSVDCIICLSHLGIHEDRLLAEQCPAVDVILGAHTHHLFEHGERVNNTLLAATGKFGQYVGHVALTIEEGKVITSKAEVVLVDQLQANPPGEEFIQTLIHNGELELEEGVFSSPQVMDHNLYAESALSDFFGQALVSYTHADAGLFNAGIFLGDLPEGVVTKKDLHQVLPHPINACVLTITGESLKTYFEASLDPNWANTKVRGLGFRGTLMGTMIHVNLTLTNGVLYIGKRMVQPEETYKLATLDMFTFGFFFPTMKFETIDYIVPELIRDIAGWYGAEKFGITY